MLELVGHFVPLVTQLKYALLAQPALAHLACEARAESRGP